LISLPPKVAEMKHVYLNVIRSPLFPVERRSPRSYFTCGESMFSFQREKNRGEEVRKVSGVCTIDGWGRSYYLFPPWLLIKDLKVVLTSDQRLRGPSSRHFFTLFSIRISAAEFGTKCDRSLSTDWTGKMLRNFKISLLMGFFLMLMWLCRWYNR